MILDDIIEVGKKFLPDKDKKLEYEIEMRKLNIEEFKEKKGIITRAFHLVFPFTVGVWLVFLAVQFYLKIQHFIKTDIWLLQDFVPKELHLVVLWFLCLLMPKKIIEAIADAVIKYIQNKFK